MRQANLLLHFVILKQVQDGWDKRFSMANLFKQVTIPILHRSKSPARRAATLKKGQPFGPVSNEISLTFKDPNAWIIPAAQALIYRPV